MIRPWLIGSLRAAVVPTRRHPLLPIDAPLELESYYSIDTLGSEVAADWRPAFFRVRSYYA